MSFPMGFGIFSFEILLTPFCRKTPFTERGLSFSYVEVEALATGFTDQQILRSSSVSVGYLDSNGTQKKRKLIDTGS
jgi:hypothetical protein